MSGTAIIVNVARRRRARHSGWHVVRRLAHGEVGRLNGMAAPISTAMTTSMATAMTAAMRNCLRHYQ
jgi:hypothetical protein